MKKKIETAAMASTTPVRLAKYFLALSISAIAKESNSQGKAVALVKEAYSELDIDSVQRLGFSRSYFDRVQSYDTMASNTSTFKSVAKNKVANNPRVPKEEADALTLALLVLSKNKTDLAGQVDRIIALANKISPKFGTSISAAVGDSPARPATNIKGIYDDLRKVVKDITGKAGIKIPQDQLNKAKVGTSKQAALVSSYNAIRRRLVVKYDADLASYIGAQSKPPYVHEVYAHMVALGYETHRVIAATKKLPLKVNIAGGKVVYMTEDGRDIDGGIPPDATKIVFMKTYDPATGTGAYLSYTTPTANGVTRKYTSEHKKTAGKQKFDKADMVAENITKYVTKWTRDLTSRDDIVAMAATVCLLIYKTGMRVGTKVGSRSISGEVAYGALTLLTKQVTLSSTKITLKYAAKKQVAQVHVIPIKDKIDKQLLKNLTEFTAGKKPTELVFSLENHRGTMKRLNPTQLTAYLKSMGYTAGIHKIRHVRGTNLAISLLNSVPWRPAKEAKSLTQKQASAEAYIKSKILEPVANLLGHKSKDGKPIWQTSISNYLNPQPFIKWFNDNGLRVPKWVPKVS